jgi:hypothetical protein
MSKFTSLIIDQGYPPKSTSHAYGYSLILPGIIDGGNNFTTPYACKWPAELTHVLRPMYKEYYISGDLSYYEFTKKNAELEKYVSVMNPCCDINKNNGSSIEFLLCSFDPISKAFIGNGEIHNKVIGVYLSATRCLNHSYQWRDATIFLPGSEAIGKANELGLMVGVASFISNSSGPCYRFNVIQNYQLWDTCLSYR